MKEICALCGSKTKKMKRIHIADHEWVCWPCYQACGYKVSAPVKKMTAEEAIQAFIGPRQNTWNTWRADNHEAVVHELEGIISKLILYDDRLVISYPQTGENSKIVYLSEISAVFYKKAGLASGSIQFFYGIAKHSGKTYPIKPNSKTIEFTDRQNDVAEKVYRLMAHSLQRPRLQGGLRPESP